MCEQFSSNIKNFILNLSNCIYQRNAPCHAISQCQTITEQAHKIMQTQLTMLAFRAAYISSALCSNIFGAFVVEDCGTSGDFNSLSLIMVLGLGEKMPYKCANILSEI